MPVHDNADVRAFFDRCAPAYAEAHGDPRHLMAQRLALVRREARLRPDDVVLDLGCGPGHHLLALAPEIARGIGVDLSPAMIEVARASLAASSWGARLRFEAGDAANLEGLIAADSVDLVLCFGALEHMLDKPAALASIHRVLRAGGRFFCLTPSGDYLWYRTLAPLLGFATKHLSTDVFLTRDALGALLARAGFDGVRTGCWTFIPGGDMPGLMARLLRGLDTLGRLADLRTLRGGLWVCATKP
jgi:2-polyprenyl-6-hydroxyphenyl methylase/3-demethylubiquinone-9 3-methyltransferase